MPSLARHGGRCGRAEVTQLANSYSNIWRDIGARRRNDILKFAYLLVIPGLWVYIYLVLGERKHVCIEDSPFFVYMFICFWERESPCAREGQRERERGRQRVQSRLCAESREPRVGLQLTKHKIMTWAKVRHLTEPSAWPWRKSFKLKLVNWS